MFASRRFGLRRVITFAVFISMAPVAWALVIYLLYASLGLEWLKIPFQPLSVMGIAVAFYAGFKNNSAYDRFWEGRKIWGGVVNESRTWASNVLNYVRPGDNSEEAVELRRVLVYRHIAWINALRLQLRSTSRFFDKPAAPTKRRLENHAVHMRNNWDKEIGPFLQPDEFAELTPMANTATHLVHRQGQDLASELATKRIDLFHQIAMMAILRELYTLQGKAERIKKTPLPRQYAEYSRVFMRAFILAVPFGLLTVFSEQLPAEWPGVEQIPWIVSYLLSAGGVAWVFLTMEGVGDMSEDPFERSMGDVPMNALCRVIERDLRQMLGETDIPANEDAIDGILY